MQSNTLIFFVNGKKVTDDKIEPEWTLLHYLRTKLHLTGTKLGCGEGGCGACTVMVSKYNRKNSKITHMPVNACLAPICSVHGCAVTTVEGIGSTRTRLHPIQERIAKSHGSQCGFCTPGMVMSMYALLRSMPNPTIEQFEIAFQGNLCRCTGYRPIIEGFKTFLDQWAAPISNGTCPMGDKCCKLTNGHAKPDESNDLFDESQFKPYDPTQEPIFPPELKLSDHLDREYLAIIGREITWLRPVSWKELLKLKMKHPEAKLVVGNSEVGVEMKFKHQIYPILIQPNQIRELNEITMIRRGVRVGAAVTLTQLDDYLRTLIKTLPEKQTRIFKEIVKILHTFAGKQIRSVGCIGGNIMTASPISDLIPILLANKVRLEVESSEKGPRHVYLDENFFVGYRKTIVEPQEILKSIEIPFSHSERYFYAYKQARRREDDIAIVNAAFNIEFQPKSHIIDRITMAFGGMSWRTVTAPKTQEALKGLNWENPQVLDKAFDKLLEDLPLSPEAPGGMIAYRRALPLSLFFKMYLTLSNDLGLNLDAKDRSAFEHSTIGPYKSAQYFKLVPETQEKYDTIQRPIVHRSAFLQSSGEAQYFDDIPPLHNEAYLAFVTSTRSHAKILSIDTGAALEIDGVYDFISGADIDKERNRWGTVVHDEKIFYDDVVTSQGQIIGAIVAQDQATAQKAARIVKVTYENLEPTIVTIEDAIKHNSYFSTPVLVSGDVDAVFRTAPHTIEGQCRIGGQEHFYFETQGALVIPKPEKGEMEIWSSTQNPSEISALVAEVLNVHQNKIVTKTKRIGGGFGGKESKAAMIAIPLAVAAAKLQRPIRCMLDRDEDMTMTGGRHPYLFHYKTAFDEAGRILACDVKLYTNCGYSLDLSGSMLGRAMTHFENAYKIPVARVNGFTCKTNLPSNTAFRGFGGPQGMYVAECIMQDIADYLDVDVAILSEKNLYHEDDITHYDQKLTNCTLEKCWKSCLSQADFHRRQKDVENFNRTNRYRKRGLNIIPTKYGIAFNATFLNQAGALVLVYNDGSVLLYHGGVEIGQGLYTKMIQVASRVLEIDVDKIHTMETSTATVPNTSPTAASSAADLNGMAVLDACTVIKERLEPYRKADPQGKWEEWVKKAYYDRVSLSATGFYRTPDIGCDPKTGKGNIFNYFTYGVGCSEVEIDTLTGDHQVIRTDIVMDLGESLNPAIDIGQIEGAFMQGYGLFVLEEMVYSPSGTIFTRGPGTYKLPGFADIPREFNVSLLKGVGNPRAVYSSKAVGEPPLFLGASVFFAVKAAIKAAREENGFTKKFDLDAPATAAKIRMACQDKITDKIEIPKSGTYTPWNVTV